MDRSLEDWLAYQQALHPVEIELGLERIRRVFERLHIRPPRRLVTIAGTNGKGTAAHSIDALARRLGWTTARYTSPHLYHYRERICCDGQPVDDPVICQAFATVEDARGGTGLTYFEFGTLAAFVIFAQHNPDLWVLEVGLGGRLDATNLLDADVSILCSIALDHQAFLGGDLAGIAAEKAGVARAGRPAIIADEGSRGYLQSPLEKIGATVVALGRDWNLSEEGEELVLHWEDETYRWRSPPALNRGSCSAAILALRHWFSAAAIRAQIRALEELIISGRCEVQPRDYGELVCDVAHNPAACARLSGFLKQSTNMRQWLVFGVQADKDHAGMAEQLAPLAEKFFLCDLPRPRGATAEALSQLFPPAHTQRYASAREALAAAENQARELAQRASLPVRIIICGSFETVAALGSG